MSNRMRGASALQTTSAHVGATLSREATTHAAAASDSSSSAVLENTNRKPEGQTMPTLKWGMRWVVHGPSFETLG